MGCAAIVLAGGWWVRGAWPYELTYANPLMGGNPAAHRTIASGWGEGLDEAARYLNERTTSGRLRAAMPGEIYTTVLDAQLNGTVAPAEGFDAGAYDALVVYLRNVQLGERPPFFDEELLAWVPDQTVVLNGVPYAWIYSTRAGAPVGRGLRRPAGAGRLRPGHRHASDRAAAGASAALASARAAAEGARRGGRAAAGRVVGSPYTLTLPLEPSGTSGEPSTWPAEERTSVTYQLPLDPGLPADNYVLAVRVVDADWRIAAGDHPAASAGRRSVRA